MFKTIVTAVDGSRHAQRAIEIAAGMAAAFDARLVLVHVAGHGPVPESLAHMAEIEHLAEPPRPTPGQTADVSSAIAAAHSGERSRAFTHQVRVAIGDRMLEDARSDARRHGAQAVEIELEEGEPAEGILRCAERVDADLVVMGTRGLSDLKGLLLGSVSHKLCQFGTCPVLTVK